MNRKLISRSTAALALSGALTTSAAFAMPSMMMGKQHVQLMAAPPAKNAGLQNATGYADVDMKRKMVKFSIMLAPGTRLPAR